MNKNTNLSPVFLISSGRSGSTLLQRYLNLSDDLVIWGEHGGVISGFSRSYFSFVNQKNVQKLLNWGRKNASLLLETNKLVGVDIEWANNFSNEDLRIAYQSLLLRLFTIDVPQTARWGFKEIRYGSREIDFLIELFPASQFVFIIRDPIDTIASMIAAWFIPSNNSNTQKLLQDEKLREFISRHCTRIIRVSEGILAHSKNGYLIRFENLRDKPADTLSSVYAYLDVQSPSIDTINSLSSDVRRATKKQGIKEVVYEQVKFNKKLQEVCEMYATFGYSCMQ